MPTVFRLDVSDVELAYLILQVDASIYVAGKGQDPALAARYLEELTIATERFVELHGLDSLSSLLDRMYRLTGLRR